MDFSTFSTDARTCCSRSLKHPDSIDVLAEKRRLPNRRYISYHSVRWESCSLRLAAAHQLSVCDRLMIKAVAV
jgi:hypothetical protein